MSQPYRPYSVVGANQPTRRAGQRARGLLAAAIVVPLVIVTGLFLLPSTRHALTAHPGIVAVVLTVVLAAVVAAVLLSRRRHQAAEAELAQSRGAWAAAHRWQYRAEERLAAPDVLSEVDPAVTRPVPVQFEANGTWRGRQAFVQSRDTWVWIRASLRKSRRTVVGIQAQIDLPRIVLVTDLNQAAANVVNPRPAHGLSRIPHPAGTRTALWTPNGLERVLLGVLQPMLPALDQGIGATQITMVCSDSWVLISAEFDADDTTVEHRLNAATEIAEALERGAQRS